MMNRATGLLATMTLVALTLAACGDSGGGLCDRLPDTSFQSEEQISFVESPDGVVPSYEYVDFGADEVEWLYTDVVEFGEWDCRGDRVSFLDGRFAADVLDEGGRLVLDRDGTRYLETH